MPKINLKGASDTDVHDLPLTVTFGALFAALIPTQDGETETALSHNRTRFSAPYGSDATLNVIVKNAETGVRNIGGTDHTLITKGVVQSVTIVDSVRTHGATHLGLHATDLIPAIRHYASGSDDGSELANLIFSKNWTILGRAADDILQWDGATVDIFAGNDTFNGGGGNDVIELYKGNDHGIGGAGFDALIGDGGNDKLEGGAQKDDLMGGTGRDILLGGSGADRLDGGPGSDKLVGGGGNDRMIGGAGNDRMNGGHGHDVFFFDTGSGHDRITHFDVNHDVIKLTGGDHGVKIVNIAHGVRVVHDGGMIDLIGVHHGALHHGDILGW